MNAENILKTIPGEWVALGVFSQPHGVSGRIKVKSLSDRVDDFSRTSELTDERGTPVKLRITGHTQGMAIVEIEGVTRREQAELLRGKKIGVSRAALPQQANPNRFYIHDLIGLSVVTLVGEPFGTVSNVVNYGASDILEISRPNGAQELYAFTHATFPSVDAEKKIITINPPEVID